ncbi:response regulator [Dehalobacter sp. DCM]|uniref:response regulator n=1 Tax=Dehalobacter sp. DCM TaxID=2907827 RepID=UPI003081BBB9|nr:response regulator [Dehalobacter sp. DCM]
MNILIAEDDLASRKYLYKWMSKYGSCDMTVDGIEAVEAFTIALDMGNPYDLVCLDIMMPKVDGIKALKAIRDIEKQRGTPEGRRAKIIMTSALNEDDVVSDSLTAGSEAFVTKPINLGQMEALIKDLLA